MGTINKFANLYDKDGKLIEKAPIKSKIKQFPPRQTKYPGSNMLINPYLYERAINN
jgi:hypothetical protein